MRERKGGPIRKTVLGTNNHGVELGAKINGADLDAITGREPSFTPGGEPPLVPVPHPGASIRD